MKIALFSDIHANLPAFEAFLADLDSRKPDAVYCLGDLVGYNVSPNEIIDEIRRRGIATLAGNHDLKVNGLRDISMEQLQASGKDYGYHIIDEDNRNYLLSLPSHIRLEYQLNGHAFNILLVHGSPRSANEYVLEDTDSNYVSALMSESNANLLCVGHSHKPYQRLISDDRAVINIGSVGKPKDGNPDGCYVILSFDQFPGNNISVEFVRFAYDIDIAVKAIEDSPLPKELADQLIKAY